MPKSPVTGVVTQHGRYYRRQYIGIENGKRRYKWHRLTRVSEGLPALYKALYDLGTKSSRTSCAIPARMNEWLPTALPGLCASEQKEITRMAEEIKATFREFTTQQVQASHILRFLEQWIQQKKRRTAQRYRATLRKFFAWVIIQGDRTDNPVDPVSTPSPKKNTTYMPHEAFLSIRAKLLGTEQHKCASGEMMQCYVDLLYLTGQRGKDIYSLKWQDIDDEAGVIHLCPSKIAHTTGGRIDIPITEEIADVLARARRISNDKARISPWVIHTLRGDKYSAHGLNSAWSDARKRAGIPTHLQYTLKNLRPKHGTDAKKAGYSIQQIQEAFAHSDPSTTRLYIQQFETPVSAVKLALPRIKNKAEKTD